MHIAAKTTKNRASEDIRGYRPKTLVHPAKKYG